MKHSLILGAALLASLLVGGCGRKEEVANIAEPRVAIVPFRATGAAESGQYALLLSNFSNVLASEFGARSRWQVMESERVNTLEDEQRLEIPPDPPPAAEPPVADGEEDGKPAADAPEAQPAEAAATWAATFPAADYVLLGQIRGFDVAPEDGRAAGQSLARRVNRVRSRIDVRIVDVRTRGWIASRTVYVDEKLNDDSAAESQINRAMDIAANKVVTAVLLAVAREFQVTEVEEGRIRLSGGAEQGLATGQEFRVIGKGKSQSSRIEIVEALPEFSVAKLLDGDVQVGDRVPAQPLQVVAADQSSGKKIPRIAVGILVPTGVDVKSVETNLLATQLRQELSARFQQYSGLRVVDTDTVTMKQLMGEQLLEDLSKGRDPGMPMGSLHGVDYLILGSLTSYEFVGQRREITQMFGTTLVQDFPPKMLFDGRVHILDVNSGEYMSTTDLSLDVDLTGLNIQRALTNVARTIGAEAYARTILQLRPLTVTKVSDGRVVLNHQAASGLAVGDRFTVMTPGEDSVDPYTGVPMRSVGGREIGTLTIAGFGTGGWAYANTGDVEAPPVGALLIRQTGDAAEEPVRKLNW